MKCPVDQTELVISDRQGVEIDYCPTCRGVWLDRGELDKVIDRSEHISVSGPSGRGADDHRDVRDDDYRDREDDDDGRRYDGRKKKKRESFLGDLFDFG
jgi:Zn-finger nucleic acid-binding protein